jgi:hypothetical protein
MPVALFAVTVPDWAAIGAFVAGVLAAIGALVAVLRKSRAEQQAALTDNELRRRREDQEIGEREESFQVRHLKSLVRDMQAQMRAESADCDSRIKLLNEEVRSIRDAERRYYAESVRQAEVVRILELQVKQLRQGAANLGIDVRSEEHRPLPPGGGGEP